MPAELNLWSLSPELALSAGALPRPQMWGVDFVVLTLTTSASAAPVTLWRAELCWCPLGRGDSLFS